MILRYQVSEAGEGDDGGARKALLEWLRSIGINANDLTNEYRITKISILISISWVDGKKILNLINKIRPDTVEESQITVESLLY